MCAFWWSFGSFALYVLTNCIQFFGRRIASYDIYRANLGPLVGGDRIFAQQFDANVANENGRAQCQDAYNRIGVHLNDDPRTGARNAHCCHQYKSLGPMVYGETFFPIEPNRADKKTQRIKNPKVPQKNVLLTCQYVSLRTVNRTPYTWAFRLICCNSRPTIVANIRDAPN